MSVTQIGKMFVHGISDAQVAFLKSRERFVNDYCAGKEWNKDALTIEQIMEIRAQEGWKNPIK